ncbi:DUF1450 domain-containing protein [Ammoniphilus resinae]|uniref:DUF1450 domain-containing protein n=1 Tax=Ammoniphilus resinae TaxID=861532 RepID=UPI003158DDE9
MVKFCTANDFDELELVKKKLQFHFPILEEDCLGNCGQCYLEGFVLYEGEFIAVTTFEKLLDRLRGNG